MSKSIYFADLTHQNEWGFGSDTIPIQLGLIAAYCVKEHGDRIDVRIFKHLDHLEAAVRDHAPFILAASNYMWNLDLGCKVARIVRERHPEVITIFGGPNFPDEFDEEVAWLEQRPEVDFYVLKDGEIPFAQLVGFLLDDPDVGAAKRAELPSIRALHEGTACFGPTAPRLRDLSIVPSPYSMGLLDHFFDKRMVPAIQTNRGCPFACTFCTEGNPYYNKVYKTTHERKMAEVDYIVSHVKHTGTLRISDSNFGMFKEDVAFCEYLSEVQQQTGYPEYIMCSAGKNRKERILECNDLLGGAMRLTASVQSMSPEVLENVKRKNVSTEDVVALSDQTSDGETHSYSEIILGLPGDSIQRERDTIEELMRIGISNITQHQLALIYASELSNKESRQKHRMRSMFRPVQRCFGSYEFLGDRFSAIEFEEICVETDTMPFEDYLEGRRLYFSVGHLYNDRIFGEIHALLRVLRLSTFGWLRRIHDEVQSLPAPIRALYEGFTEETRGELWNSVEELRRDISADLDRYLSGQAGGSIIYKWRAKSFVEHFEDVHAVAYDYLRRYLAENGVECEEAVEEIERYSRLQKFDLFDPGFEAVHTFRYDIDAIINQPKAAKQSSIDTFKRSTTLRFSHTEKQRQTLRRELEYHGRDIAGLTRLLSQFPFKRFYRRVERIETER